MGHVGARGVSMEIDSSGGSASSAALKSHAFCVPHNGIETLSEGLGTFGSTRVLAKRLRCNLSVKAVCLLLYVTKDGLTTLLALTLNCVCNGWRIKKLPATQISYPESFLILDILQKCKKIDKKIRKENNINMNQLKGFLEY